MKKENVRNVNTFQLFMVVLLMFLATCKLNAQLKVGNNPKTINSNTIFEMESTNKGMLLPRMALSATNSFAPMTAHVAGMTIYNTATAGDVTPGFYFNDGSQWIRIENAANEPWFNVATNSSATSNTQNIYQMGNVGIGNTNPQAKLDIIGNIKFNGALMPSNKAGTNGEVLMSKGIDSTPVWQSPFIFGQVIYALKSSDFNGWVILDGRAKSTLTPSQQTQATLLGIGVNIPNATNAVLMQSSNLIGTTTGNNMKIIQQNQLPNITLSGTTSSSGAHTHTYTDAFYSENTGPGGNAIGSTSTDNDNNLFWRTNSGAHSAFPEQIPTSSSGAHTHTITVNSINGNQTQQSLDITPMNLSMNAFIYLGN